MRVLFILPRFPYPLYKGDQLRCYFFLSELSKYHQVHLICLSDIGISENWRVEIAPFCKSIQIINLSKKKIIFNLLKGIFNRKPFQSNYFQSKKFNSAILETIEKEKIEICFFQLIRTASSDLIQSIKRKFPNTKLVLDFMDSLSSGMKKRALLGPWYEKGISRIEANRLINYEYKLGKLFDICTIISKSDWEQLPPEVKENTRIVPNGVSEGFFQKREKPILIDLRNEHYPILIFTGNMNYRPNIDAAIYLVKQILPRLNEKYPKTLVYIAGIDPSQEVKFLTSDQVVVTGFVPDLRIYLSKAHIFVSPLFLGSGLQNKLLEGMAMGLPVITTTLTWKSLGGEPDKDLLIADTVDEFIRQITKCLQNPNWALQIGLNGQKYTHENFNWERWGNYLNEIFLNLKK